MFVNYTSKSTYDIIHISNETFPRSEQNKKPTNMYSPNVPHPKMSLTPNVPHPKMSLTPNVPQLISPMHVCWYRPSHKANCHHNTKALEQIASVTVKARVKTFTAWRAVARHALLNLARAVLPRRKLGQPPACICSVAVKYLGDQDA